MVTSKSGSGVRGWTAGAHLYSGRPDPAWSISESVMKKLLALWESLPPAGEQQEMHAAGLGYRGSFLRGDGKREWVAFKGLVSLRTSARVQVRKDAAREFEKMLLSSAPKGLLPEGLIEGRWAPK
jgi:hypothetical protein